MRKLALFLGVAVLACSTYRDHLVRGQRLYQENKYDEAIAVWRVLELNMDSLEYGDQARYAYLRGMTDYRLGFRQDARHWLAIAKAIEQEHPGGLVGDWPKRIDAALTELNREVYGISASEDGDGAEATPNTEGFDAVACASDADCKLQETCVEGACRPSEQVAPPESP